MWLRIFLFVLLLCIPPLSSLADHPNLLRSPIHKTHVETATKETKGSSIRRIAAAPILLYQELFAPVTQDKCSHYPSCSNYCRIAIKKHGVIVGAIMTFDRLQRESNEAKFSPLIKVKGVTKVYDPVENNDFWWYRTLSRGRSE